MFEQKITLRLGEKKSSVNWKLGVIDGYLQSDAIGDGNDAYARQSAFLKGDKYYTSQLFSTFIDGKKEEGAVYSEYLTPSDYENYKVSTDENEIVDFVVSSAGGGFAIVENAFDELLKNIGNPDSTLSIEKGDEGAIKLINGEDYLVFDNAARLIESNSHSTNKNNEKIVEHATYSYYMTDKLDVPDLKNYTNMKDVTEEDAARYDIIYQKTVENLLII